MVITCNIILLYIFYTQCFKLLVMKKYLQMRSSRNIRFIITEIIVLNGVQIVCNGVAGSYFYIYVFFQWRVATKLTIIQKTFFH